MKLRLIIKRTVKKAFKIATIPLYLLFEINSALGDRDSVFRSWSQMLSLVPGLLGVYFRASFYSLACPATSDEIVIGFLTIFSHRDTTIQKGVYIGPQCNIGKSIIKNNTLVGSGVHILSGSSQHNFSDTSTPIKDQGGTYLKISIGEDCWIGNGAIIMASVGNQSIIAAGSLINKDIGTRMIVGGNPAKVIRER